MTDQLEQERRDLAALVARRRDEMGLNPDGTDPRAPSTVGAAADDMAERVARAQKLSAEARYEREARDAAEQAAADADIARWRDAWWRDHIPSRFVEATAEQLDGKLAEASDWDGTCNVLLVGNVGAGKTHAAVALARTVHDRGGSVAFWPVVELLDALRPSGDEKAMDRALAVDVLVLDDLGLERPSDWTFERLYALVNRRWLEQRPTIVTSNLPVDELEAAVGAPMWSRLYHGALRLSAGGPDRRREQA